MLNNEKQMLNKIYPKILKRIKEITPPNRKRSLTIRERAKNLIFKDKEVKNSDVLEICKKLFQTTDILAELKGEKKIEEAVWKKVKKYYESRGIPLSKYESDAEHQTIERIPDAKRAEDAERERLVHEGVVKGKVRLLDAGRRRRGIMR
jgi:hypothetical protein